MPYISLRAIKNNAHLTGAEINLREGLASFCALENPSTARALKDIAGVVGMDMGQASKVMTRLEGNGEVKQFEGRFYLLRLDDYQIEKIAEKNPDLLKILANLGSIEAKERVDKESNLNDSESNLNGFLLRFFLCSQLTHSHLNMTGSQPPVDNESTLIDGKSTPLKDINGVNGIKNGVNGEKEVEAENVSCTEARSENEPAASPSASDGAIADSDSLPDGDKDDPPANKLNGEKNHEKTKESWVNDHTRSDIKGLDNWLAYLQKLPECENIPIQVLWDKYDVKSKKRKAASTRNRFLQNWLWPDVSDVAEKQKEEIEENAIVQGSRRSSGGKTFKQQRDEYAAAEHTEFERTRERVSRRRDEILRRRDASDR